jgi:hypothetical protein
MMATATTVGPRRGRPSEGLIRGSDNDSGSKNITHSSAGSGRSRPRVWMLLVAELCCFLLFLVPNCDGVSEVTVSAPRPCGYVDISDTLAHILCDVESGKWSLPKNATAVTNSGCLLGGNRCAGVMHIPTQDEVPPSASPPSAKNKQYQDLATIAEKVVPKTWWRDGFSNDQLLLTHNDSDLPKKLFDGSKLRGKKLKNIVQCVTRQQFIRKSFVFDHHTESALGLTSANTPKCTAMNDPIVKRFHNLWLASVEFGGVLRSDPSTGKKSWAPDPSDNDNLRLAAIDVLDYFYANYGGIWTGCFKMERSSECRGALAGA